MYQYNLFYVVAKTNKKKERKNKSKGNGNVLNKEKSLVNESASNTVSINKILVSFFCIT